MDLIPDNCNYIEFVFLNNQSKKNDCYDVNLPQSLFSEFLMQLQKEKIKYFLKQYKCYVHKCLYLENSEELKVYEKKMIHAKKLNDHVIATFYIKDKRPYHMFPSTLNIHTVFYVKRMTFRIHNRIFVNFDVQFYPQSKKEVLKVFVNYNHDKDVDMTFIYKEIERLFKIMQLR